MTSEPNLPDPGIQSAEDRLAMSKRFQIHAHEELEKGHRLQAGNKAYGAVVQVLKVIAEQRGWHHNSNRHIEALGNVITQEYGNAALAAYITDVYHKGHRNFYENAYDREELEDLLDRLDDSLPDLYDLVEAPPRPVTIKNASQLRQLKSLTGRDDLKVGDTSNVGFSNTHRNDGSVTECN